MEIKLFGESPLNEFAAAGKARSVTPVHVRGLLTGGQLNPRQMFSSALRRTDISPLARENSGAALNASVDCQNRQVHFRSYTQDYHTAVVPPSPLRETELTEITNSNPPAVPRLHGKWENEPLRSDPYKEMYERAIARHAEERESWSAEKKELMSRIARLETTVGAAAPPAQGSHQAYLLKIDQEIEELKNRMRRTEQQNEFIRSRSKAKTY